MTIEHPLLCWARLTLPKVLRIGFRHTRKAAVPRNKSEFLHTCTERSVRDFRLETEISHRHRNTCVERRTDREQQRRGIVHRQRQRRPNWCKASYVAAERRGGSTGERQGQRQHGMRYYLSENPEPRFSADWGCVVLENGVNLLRDSRGHSVGYPDPTVRCRRECCCCQTGSAKDAGTVQVGPKSRTGNTAL